MARPQQAFNKLELEKKRLKKQKVKNQKKEERKANSEKGKTLEEMFAYVDHDGNIVSTQPDPAKKKGVNAEDIQISVSRKEDINPADLIRKGTVTFFNDAKGYGFIKDTETQESIFVHLNGLTDKIKENDKVTFETENGHKGLNAIRVKLIK